MILRLGVSSQLEAELVEALDEFAELVAEMLNHCGPLTVGQKVTIRAAVVAWWDMRAEIVEG